MIDWTDPVLYIKITTLLLVVETLLLLIFKNSIKENWKKAIFIIICAPILLSSLYLAGHTINKNIHSVTGGPVHWHADYQVWVCGERLNLIDPTGLNNKIGSPLFHEHNDDRIHVEGTVESFNDINLGSYFKVIGGELSNNKLSYPTEEKGLVQYENGQNCPDGNSGTLSVYVNGAKKDDFATYVKFPHALVPPGDCIVVEFGTNNKATTERICESWQAMGWSYENFEEKRNGGDY